MVGFFDDVKKFNDMYGLPNNDSPTIAQPDPFRLANFQSILEEEVEEGAEILEKAQGTGCAYFRNEDGTERPQADGELDFLTDLADWLGDIVVYCASEARRWGIPLEEVLKIIMESNFSKLGEDGKPIYDERGKVMKGPNYWKPEPKIRALLEQRYNGVKK